MRERWSAWAVVVIVAVVIGLGAFGRADSAVDTVEVGTIDGGSGLLVRLVIEQYDLDGKNGLKVKWLPFATPQTANSTFALGKFPVHSSMNPIALVRLRNAGKDIVAVYSALKLNLYVVVKKDSPYTKFADLRGKRLGITGWTTDSTVALVALARQVDKLDLKKDLSVFVAAPPALMGLLEKGEIDAVYIYDPFALKLLLSGNYRQIMDTGAEWERAHQESFLMSTIGVYVPYAKSNPEIVRKVVKTMRDAFDTIARNPAVFTEIGFFEKTGLDRTPEAEKLLRERLSRLFPNRFDPSLVKSVNLQIGESVRMGLVEKERDDWYTFEYLPGR